MAQAIVAERRALSERKAIVFRPPVDIGGEGHAITVSWDPVAGVTAAEVTQANLTLYPSVAEETHPNATVRADGAGWDIDVPAKRRVRAIALVGLKQPGGQTLTGALPGGMRLTVAFPQQQAGGFDSPRFAVPAVDRDGAVPQTLTGASFSGGVLQLTPATAAARVRVALVTGANPPEFSDQATELTKVNLTTHRAAQNATVTGPDGTVVWSVPEFDPDADPAEIDLRHALEAALNPQVTGGGPLKATFTVSADAPARAAVNFGGVAGFLVRVEDRVVRTVLEGDPIAPSFAPFASEAPHSASGDLTVRYDGLRILETVSDPLPAAPGLVGEPRLTAASGVVVGPAEALRAFPPRAFDGQQPARLGVFGRAPELCELAIEFVEMIGATAGRAVAPPAVIAVAPSSHLRTHWAAVPQALRLEGANGIRVRTNSGRFFWAFNAAEQPLVRVAIVDPDPGGRPLLLGATQLVSVTGDDIHQPAFAFPAAAFRGGVPSLSSNLFLTVDVSDLAVRYAR